MKRQNTRDLRYAGALLIRKTETAVGRIQSTVLEIDSHNQKIIPELLAMGAYSKFGAVPTTATGIGVVAIWRLENRVGTASPYNV